MMEERLTSLLLGDVALRAVVDDRINWLTSPQAISVPRIVLNRITGVRSYHMQGPANLVESRIQADCYADTYAGAKDASRALMALLSGYRDDTFFGIFIDDEREYFVSNPNASERFYRVRVDLLLHHTE